MWIEGKFPLAFKRFFFGVANTDIDECEEENLCGENATCVNTPGSYSCVWNSGYGLKSANISFSGQEEQGEGEDRDTLFLIVDPRSEPIWSYKY